MAVDLVQETQLGVLLVILGFVHHEESSGSFHVLQVVSLSEAWVSSSHPPLGLFS